MYESKIVHFENTADIEKAFSEIHVDPVAKEIMMEKFQFLILRLDDVRCVEANILKQEMLVLGEKRQFLVILFHVRFQQLRFCSQDQKHFENFVNASSIK